MRKAIKEIRPEHMDWKEYEKAATVNLKSLQIQLRTCYDMIKTARQMMDKTKNEKDMDDQFTKDNKEQRDKCESTKTEECDTKKNGPADI